MNKEIQKNNYFIQYICILFFIFNYYVAQSQVVTNYIVNLSTPQSLELDGTNLYFSETNGNISVVNITQINPIPNVLASGITFPTGLEIYGTVLFVADYGSGVPPYNGKIFKMDLSTANPTPIQIASGIASPSTLLAHQDYLYYSAVNSGGSISKLNLSISNPSPTTIITSGCACRIYGLEMFGNELYYIQANQLNNFTIYKIDITSASPTPVVVLNASSGFTGPIRLRKIDNYMYISDILADKIFKFNPSDSNPSLELVVANVDGAKDCMPYLEDLYIVESAGNKISKLSNYNLGVDENYLNRLIKLYPNPSKDHLIISNINEPFEFKILNNLGQVLIQGRSEPKQIIDISRLEQGTYFLQFENGYIKKFIKS